VSGQDCDGAKGQAPIKSLLAKPLAPHGPPHDRVDRSFSRHLASQFKGQARAEVTRVYHRSQFMKGLTLSAKEQNRLQILNGVLKRHWSMEEAAPLLGVSERQGWRLLAAYRKEGARGLAHKNRGRIPPNATSATIQRRVVALVRERYQGVNHTHLTELLEKREGLRLSRPTVRRILVRAGLSSPRRRRPPQHRCRRQRMPQEGMLLQLDGSPHAWLEDRGPWLTLLLAIDDATGTAPYALFQEQEDTRGYFSLLWGHH
jgi:transposase